MLKYLIFFTLILLIQNEFNSNQIYYLRDVYNLFKSPKIPVIEKFEEMILKSEENRLNKGNNDLLEVQIKKFGFNLKENVHLKVSFAKNKKKAKDDIIKYIEEKNMRDKHDKELAELFTQGIEYDNIQWRKYDLLISTKGTINALSILTKKTPNECVTIYFTSMGKLKYSSSTFVLINKSINIDNPFNDYFSLTQYERKWCLFCIQKHYMEIAKGNKINIPDKDILIRYYSILSYSLIANELNERYVKPFE